MNKGELQYYDYGRVLWLSFNYRNTWYIPDLVAMLVLAERHIVVHHSHGLTRSHIPVCNLLHRYQVPASYLGSGTEYLVPGTGTSCILLLAEQYIPVPDTATYVQMTTNDSQDQTNMRFVQASSFLDSTIFGETKLPIFLP